MRLPHALAALVVLALTACTETTLDVAGAALGAVPSPVCHTIAECEQMQESVVRGAVARLPKSRQDHYRQLRPVQVRRSRPPNFTDDELKLYQAARTQARGLRCEAKGGCTVTLGDVTLVPILTEAEKQVRERIHQSVEDKLTPEMKIQCRATSTCGELFMALWREAEADIVK